MLSSRKKLLFLLSLELLLLSLLYVPLLIIAALSAAGTLGFWGDFSALVLVFGPPVTVAVTDMWIAATLIMRGVHDKNARPIMWFGLVGIAVQLAVIGGSIYSVDVAVPWSCIIGFGGLVAAGFMKRDQPPATPNLH